MNIMTPEEKRKHDENPNILLKIAGKPFYCTCGCNVFHHPSIDKDVYKCNSCTLEYHAE